jgi:hypothetical protein
MLWDWGLFMVCTQAAGGGAFASPSAFRLFLSEAKVIKEVDIDGNKNQLQHWASWAIIRAFPGRNGI